MVGFIAHLRQNGYSIGLAEADMALSFLAAGNALSVESVRLGLKTMLTGNSDQWSKFDDVFRSYWFADRSRSEPSATEFSSPRAGRTRPRLWDRPPTDSADGAATGPVASAGGNGKPADTVGCGRLVASRTETLARTDLRHLVDPADIDEAERVAERLARAIRYRLSRRRKAARRGRIVDLRRTIRRNLPHGGEPVEIVWRRRPLRPANLVLLVDVSGSMKVYSRCFLAFVRGLIGAPIEAEAFLFHTRLVRISGALRDADPMRSLARLSLMADGFGGGTQIAASVRQFNDRHAREVISSRSVVIVMSDGYDTDPPELLTLELERLKRRARRLVWLNPLLGWRDYAPVARGMAASLPHIDLFAAAHTLEALAALECELAQL